MDDISPVAFTSSEIKKNFLGQWEINTVSRVTGNINVFFHRLGYPYRYIVKHYNGICSRSNYLPELFVLELGVYHLLTDS